MRQLINELVVLKQERAVGSSAQAVVVIMHRRTVRGGEKGPLRHLSLASLSID
jgi:hypothetical protein